MSVWPANGWAHPVSLLLFCTAGAMMLSGIEDTIPERNLQDYFSSLQPSKASLVYFRKDTSPSAELFLEQLENSIEALQDYGISVLKVSCHRGEASGYCKEGNYLEKAYLFKGHVLLRELPMDALFNVDAIIANVLFALLFNEVRYIATVMDLKNVEDSLKGQSDLVFAYVQAVGTADHRVVMEAAFVYGARHQFALTTEVALLRNVGNDESDVPTSKLFFCHCKLATDLAQPCQKTLMGQPLATLNIHKFLKLMGEPLVMDGAEAPEKMSSLHLQLGLPLIFILAQKETVEADRRTAEFVAWRLLGKAGVVLLPRSAAGLDGHNRYNVVFKVTEEGMPVQYLVLKDTDEILALVESSGQGESVLEEDGEEEEVEDDDYYEQEIQDDEVVESVVRDKKRELSLENVLTLTEESFGPTLAKATCTAVLFYASWEAVSLVVLQSYVEAAAHLKGTPGTSLGTVNCWDWPQLCVQQNVTLFPALKMYQEGGRSLTYSGMWGTEAILGFIDLGRASFPVRLTTSEEVESYFSGETSLSFATIVLGIFDSNTQEARDAFIEAGKALTGEVQTWFYEGDAASALSRKHNVPLPALFVARPQNPKRDVLQPSEFTMELIVGAIRDALLEALPELTVGNLPESFQLQKPLLLLFTDGTLSEQDKSEMRHLAQEDNQKTFLACWLNLKNTPVGRGILKTYFGSRHPPLPVLTWVNLHSGGQVFAFPPDQSLTETNILAWIEKLKSGSEVPSSTLSDENWRPRLPAYDFLGMMAPALPEFTIYSRSSLSAPKEEEEGPVEKKAAADREETPEDLAMAEPEKESAGGDLRGAVPRLTAREKRHAEL